MATEIEQVQGEALMKRKILNHFWLPVEQTNEEGRFDTPAFDAYWGPFRRYDLRSSDVEYFDATEMATLLGVSEAWFRGQFVADQKGEDDDGTRVRDWDKWTAEHVLYDLITDDLAEEAMAEWRREQGIDAPMVRPAWLGQIKGAIPGSAWAAVR